MIDTGTCGSPPADMSSVARTLYRMSRALACPALPEARHFAAGRARWISGALMSLRGAFQRRLRSGPSPRRCALSPWCARSARRLEKNWSSPGIHSGALRFAPPDMLFTALINAANNELPFDD